MNECTNKVLTEGVLVKQLFSNAGLYFDELCIERNCCFMSDVFLHAVSVYIKFVFERTRTSFEGSILARELEFIYNEQKRTTKTSNMITDLGIRVKCFQNT
jgi:hypothetical protein